MLVRKMKHRCHLHVQQLFENCNVCVFLEKYLKRYAGFEGFHGTENSIRGHLPPCCQDAEDGVSKVLRNFGILSQHWPPLQPQYWKIIRDLGAVINEMTSQ
jgi:hypothetical protein